MRIGASRHAADIRADKPSRESQTILHLQSGEKMLKMANSVYIKNFVIYFIDKTDDTLQDGTDIQGIKFKHSLELMVFVCEFDSFL